jgi:hypothetical protein
MNGLHGAKPITWGTFRGYCPDVDPGELPAHLASYAANVDFTGETVQKRKGRYPYNEQAMGSGGVIGVYPYYPAGNGTRKLVMAIAAAVYADLNADGDFVDASETLASSLTAGATACDFAQHRQRLYFGNEKWGLYRWDGSGTAAAVANLTAPGSAPALALVRTVLEDFETAAGWTSTNANLTKADGATDGSEPVAHEGTKALKLTAATSAAAGQFIYKAWSSGSTVDLSKAESITFWVYVQRMGTQFQLGVYENGATLSAGPTWNKFPVFRITRATRRRWVQFTVPLGAIEPASRNASPGLAIRFVDDGGRGYTQSHKLWFDDLRAVGGFTPDTYSYYYTYFDTGTQAESEPSPEGTIRVDPGQPVSGVNVTPTATAQLASDGSAVDKVRIYRKRKDGTEPFPRLVLEVSNATAATEDTLDDGGIALAAARGNAPVLVEHRANPPKAKAYALCMNRLLAGYVTVSGTDYPNRVYVSRFARPEEFADAEDPNTPDLLAAGWFDIPGADPVVRIIPFAGFALIFCTRSIWSLEGSSWEDFNLQRRADFGLDARAAVVATDSLVYFLAPDGVRVMAPSPSASGEFLSWVLSEPVASVVRSIEQAYRKNAAMGLDERGRVHLSYTPAGSTANAKALVFDPTIPDALARGYQQLRPGWTAYTTNWGFSCFGTLAYGGGDRGQLLGGDPANGRLWWLGRKSDYTALEDDYTADGASSGSVAIADGCAAMWTFEESSGNLLDRFGGVYNLPVDAGVTRLVVAPNNPDLKAYTFPVAGTGSAPTYGHVVGSRPSLNGLHSWCVEAVIRFTQTPTATRYAIEFRTAGGISLATLYRINGGDLQAAVYIGGGNFSHLVAGSANVNPSGTSPWHHVVFGLDRGNWVGYFDGVLVVSTPTGAGDVATDDGGTWTVGFGGLVDLNGFGLGCDIDFASVYPLMLDAATVLNHKVLSGV